MARNIPIRVLRATRAALDAQAGASGLLAGEPYLITDENRLAVGTGTGAYQALAKQGEIPNPMRPVAVAFDSEVAASAAVNWTQGNYQKITVSSGVTLSFTAPAGPAHLQLKITVQSGGSVAWPSGIYTRDGESAAINTVGIHIAAIYYDGASYFVEVSESWAQPS